MTTRPTASTITDEQLDALYADLAARRESERVLQGQIDAQAREIDVLREQLDVLRRLLERAYAQFPLRYIEGAHTSEAS